MGSKENRAILPPAVFLMGPTASGKTHIAMELVKHLPCEIISVDSAQVYRGMDIGTAKPDRATLSRIPHRLIDIRDPAESYSAADFRIDALREMANITTRGKIPLLVGGTMLYFKALLEGLDDMPATDKKIRAELMADAARLGWPALHARLAMIDPETAARLHPNHSQRIGRALEVYLMTGKPLSSFHAMRSGCSLPYRTLQLALIPESRKDLHLRIDQRFRDMMAAGFVEEVEKLHQRKDLQAELPALRAVGYREAWQFLGGSLTREQMIARAIISTHQLAKRQLTWLRNWRDLQTLTINLAAVSPVADAHSLDSTVAEVRQRVVDFLQREETPTLEKDNRATI